MDRRAELIDRIYAAAAGEAPWQEAVSLLKATVGAVSASLFIIPQPDRPAETVHAAALDDADMQAYALHYHRLDPWLQRLRGAVMVPGRKLRSVLGESVMPEEAYRRSAFYNEFGRRIGAERMIGILGALGPQATFHLGMIRPFSAGPFTPVDQRFLEAAAPHLRRGLQLREKLMQAPVGSVPAQALDALPTAALVVDAALRVLHANTAAERLIGPETGIRLVRDGPRSGAPVTLNLPDPAEMSRLLALVRAVAMRGAPGGGFRLVGPGHQASVLAVLVSPLPASLRPGRAEGRTGHMPGHALVLIRDLTRPAAPSTMLLQEVFGLTAAEAEVAAGMAGGTTADELSARRAVSVATVRAQIRVVVEKTGASGLRDLERILASLPAAEP